MVGHTSCLTNSRPIPRDAPITAYEGIITIVSSSSLGLAFTHPLCDVLYIPKRLLCPRGEGDYGDRNYSSTKGRRWLFKEIRNSWTRRTSLRPRTVTTVREELRSMVIQLLNRHPIPRFGGTERDPVLSCAHIGEQKVSETLA